jgi:hypothetical protein
MTSETDMDEPVTCHEEPVSITGEVVRVRSAEAVAGAQIPATDLFQRAGADRRMIHHHASLL